MRVVVLRTVMDHQLAIPEEKAIRFDFPWRLLDFIFFFFAQVGQIVDELPTICGVRNHKTELEGKFSNAFVAEVVSLDHLHVLNGLCANAEVHCQANRLKLEKVWSQMILDKTLGRVIIF